MHQCQCLTPKHIGETDGIYLSEHTHTLSLDIYIYIYIHIHILCVRVQICITFIFIPQVPHKAVAEVSRIGHYRRGKLLWCMDGGANPLMDRKVVGAVFFGVAAMVAVVTSPTTPGCSVAQRTCSCSVASCSCSCSVCIYRSAVVVAVVIVVWCN